MTDRHSTRLVAYAPNAQRLGVLPVPLAWAASIPWEDQGAASLTYARVAAGGGILARGLTQGLELALEEWDGSGWVEPDGARYVVLERSNDRLDDTDTVQLTAPAYGWLLSKIKEKAPAEGFYAAEGDNAGRRQFIGQTAGSVAITLLDEYAARGGPTIARDFTATHDSLGNPWPPLNVLWVSRGEALDVTLGRMADGGAAVPWWTGRTLRLAPPRVGRERAADVILRERTHVAEAPSTETITDLIQAHTLHGGEGLLVTDVDQSAPSPWGRWEGFASDDRVTIEASARARNQRELADAARLRGQYTRDLTPAVPYRLGVDVLPGDWVTAPTHVKAERVRVAGLLWRAQGEDVTRSVILNDRLLDAELRRRRRARMGDGVGSSGGGSDVRPAPPGQDKRTPAQVTGLVVGTQAYIDPDGAARGLIIASWAAVTKARPEDGGGDMEIDRYELAWRVNTLGAPWIIAASTADTEIEAGPFDVGTTIQVRVRARGKYATAPGIWSDPYTITVAADTTPPPVPSNLGASSALGTATFTWDGLTHEATPMPIDFSYADVQWEGVRSGVNVTGAVVLSGAGSAIAPGLDRGSTARARIRAVDRSGNESDWTDWTSVTVKSVLDDTGLDEAFEHRDNIVTQVQDEVAQAKADALAAHSAASQATLDAADANNAAVLAAERAMAAALQGPSLVYNGDFEFGNDGWSTNASQQVVESSTARSGSRVMRIDASAARIVRPQPWHPGAPGRTYRMTAYFRAVAAATAQARFTQQRRNSAGAISSVNVGSATTVGPEWTRIQVDYLNDHEDTVSLRPGLRADASGAGVLVEVDDFTVHDITDALAAIQIAEAAAQAAAGAATKADNAIVESVIEYALSLSDTTPPTSGWSTATPNRSLDQFIWMRTVITYGSGNTSTSNPVVVTGNPGPGGGEKGDPGVGIHSITPFYRRQAETAAEPARPDVMEPTGWATTMPDFLTGTVLYRSERIVYSNETFAWTDVTRERAWEIAVQALVSANGRNSIITSTEPATGTTNPETGNALVKGDTWWQWDAADTVNVIGQWTWDGSAWVRSFIDSQTIANLDVNKLIVSGSARIRQAVVDKIIGDAGFFGLLTAERFIVAAPGNLITDPAMTIQALADRRQAVSSSGVLVREADATEAADGAARIFRFEGSRTTNVNAVWSNSVTAPNNYDAAVPVTPGTSVELSARSRQWDTSDRWRFIAYLERADGSRYAPALSPFTGQESAIATKRHTWTVPDDVVKATFGIQAEGTGTSAIHVWNFHARPMVGSVLIEPGSITSDKLFVNQAFMDEIAAGFAQFDTAVIGWVKGTYISADALDFKTAVGLQITSGLFQTQPQANRGLKIDSTNGLRAFDSSGALRVRIRPTGEVEVINGTITGGTIQTSTAGQRVRMQQDRWQVLNGGTIMAEAGPDEEGAYSLQVRDPIRNQLAPVASILFGARGYNNEGTVTFNTSNGGDSGWLTDSGTNDVAVFNSLGGRYIITGTGQLNYHIRGGIWRLGFRIANAITGANILAPDNNRSAMIGSGDIGNEIRGIHPMSFTRYFTSPPGGYAVRLAFRSQSSSGSGTFCNGTLLLRTLTITPA